MWYRVHHSHKLGYCVLENQIHPAGLDDIEQLTQKQKYNIRTWIGRTLSGEMDIEEIYDEQDVAVAYLNEEDPTATLELWSIDGEKVADYSSGTQLL